MADSAERKWFVVRLRPGAGREDKRDPRLMKIERDLLENGFDFYFPMEVIDYVHRRSKKLAQKRRPLIPGYAFVTGVANFWELSECKTVAGYLNVDGRPLAMSEAEIEIIRSAETEIFSELASERRKRFEAARILTKRRLEKDFPKGSPVEIRSGLLASAEGRVVAQTGRKTLKLALERFNHLKTIEIGIDEVDLVA